MKEKVTIGPADVGTIDAAAVEERARQAKVEHLKIVIHRIHDGLKAKYLADQSKPEPPSEITISVDPATGEVSITDDK